MTEQNETASRAGHEGAEGIIAPATDDALDDDTEGHVCPRVVGDEDDQVSTR